MSRKIDGTRMARARRRIVTLLASTGAVMATTAALASAQDAATAQEGASADDAATTQDAATTGDATTAQGGGGTSPPGGGKSGGGSPRLKSEAAAPGKVFFNGKHKAIYRYSISGDRPRNMKIQAVNRRNWRVVKVWRKDDLEPGSHRITWAGNNRYGKAAKKGTYLFRIRTKQGADVDRSRTKGEDRSVKFYPEKFPVRARHTYGDGFGAARSGHTHQGQDIFADCGSPLVAARGGRVQYSGNQSGGAGYYLVVDGKSTGHDYVYMHVQKRGRAKQGERVRTGEKIARVGDTGNASGCHLHFELWSKPGWYEGGHAMRSVTNHMKKWDRWS